MIAGSKFSRLLLVSPWSMLFFLILPFLVILSIKTHLQFPFSEPAKLLLVNNICFTFFVACRLLRYLAVMRKPVRYGTCCRPDQNELLPASADDVRAALVRAGYAFTADGSYGERRDFGYLGTTAMYAGLLILLAVGCWDNLRQFSGVLLDGMGPATSLNKVESYRFVKKGLLATSIASLPRMQIISQTIPDSTYPKGATEIALITEDGKPQKFTLIPGQPVSHGAFEISMTKLVFQPQIVIKHKDSGVPLFDELVTLNPLVQKRGDYSFYGLFQGVVLGGGVYYQPEKSTLLVVITRGGEKVVTDMVFQVDQQVVAGDYTLSCAKMGQWSEIHVIHRRHKELLFLGGIMAAIGLLMRIAVRPQRVWLDEVAAGCAIWSSDKGAVHGLKDKLTTA